MAYEAAIDHAYDILRDYPRIGKKRDDLRPNLLSFPVEHHVLFYRIKGDVIEIVRIHHERADAARHFR
jgi:toxin ParE1/3/4